MAAPPPKGERAEGLPKLAQGSEHTQEALHRAVEFQEGEGDMLAEEDVRMIPDHVLGSMSGDKVVWDSSTAQPGGGAGRGTGGGAAPPATLTLVSINRYERKKGLALAIEALQVRQRRGRMWCLHGSLLESSALSGWISVNLREPPW